METAFCTGFEFFRIILIQIRRYPEEPLSWIPLAITNTSALPQYSIRVSTFLMPLCSSKNRLIRDESGGFCLLFNNPIMYPDAQNGMHPGERTIRKKNSPFKRTKMYGLPESS
jgi:hypothetical protein